MVDLPALETLVNRWMRAWVTRDLRALKALTSRNFMFVLGAQPCVILDAKSWLEAASTRFRCDSYRFRDIFARSQGSLALFAAQVEVEGSADGQDWSGRMWMTDVWRRGTVRRSWRLTEKIISRPEEDAQIPTAIRAMQLWR